MGLFIKASIVHYVMGLFHTPKQLLSWLTVVHQLSLLEKVALKGLPDETCTLDIYEDSRFGYIKENVINVDEMNCSLVNINICFTSYFTFISQQFVGPNISEFTARINHLKPPYSKPHFRLIISFDEYGNLNSE